MSIPRHEEEVDANLEVWRKKPLLRHVYGRMYQRIAEVIERSPRPIIEIGSGVGSLSESIPEVVTTDNFVRPWLDVGLDAYRLPFRSETLGAVVAVDVLHHLARPALFLQQVQNALRPGGRLVLLEPYISAVGWLVYGCFHDEPVAFREPIDWSLARTQQAYYAAQGNATRLFFKNEYSAWAADWRLVTADRFASFAYLLSGGFSRRAMYPHRAVESIERLDAIFSRWPAIFAARALVVLERR